MLRALDKLFEFCASLKLAIFLILSLAFCLAAATFYESAYGTPAVQELIYDSPWFMLLMAMLAVNVMAAVVIRYPWKRKQTGFIITHAGIEILLLGCLISHRYAVEGKVSLQALNAEAGNLPPEALGEQETGSMDGIQEIVSIDLPDSGGHALEHIVPVSLWSEAGYPSLLSFALHGFGAISQPVTPRWPKGQVVTYPMGANAKLEILDWVQAAAPYTAVDAVDGGVPAAIVKLGGNMPVIQGAPMSGRAVDQSFELSADPQGESGVKDFNGLIEFVLWKAQSQAEVEEFLNPPDPKTLPAEGRLVIILKGERYGVDVSAATIGKAVPLGASGYTATVEKYLTNADMDSGGGTADGDPTNPAVNVKIEGAGGVSEYQARAWAPEMLMKLKDGVLESHGYAGADDPVLRYDHPAAYFTRAQKMGNGMVQGGMVGRLQLLSGPDGGLYARVFKVDDSGHDAVPAPFKVDVGKEYVKTWLGFSFTVAGYQPSGVIDEGYRLANVDPNQVADYPRAMKVALTVDGQRTEKWLYREDKPLFISTDRGDAFLQYGFPRLDLGFDLKLESAEERDEPMSTQAAAYKSVVTVTGSDNDGQHSISMNEPIVVDGMVVSQSGLTPTPGGPVSTLGLRRDQGWWIKDIGCAGIVLGIFTMFYMKAYFQKAPAVATEGGKKKVVRRKEAAASV